MAELFRTDKLQYLEIVVCEGRKTKPTSQQNQDKQTEICNVELGVFS